MLNKIKKMMVRGNIKNLLKVVICILTMLSSVIVKADVIVVDAKSRQPLPKASIFDKNGIFIAVADDNGKVPESILASAYPLNIRYVGYLPVEVETPDAGMVMMEETSYTLPEVTIDNVSRNILYLRAFVREYETLDNSKDTVALFKEQVVDYAIPVGKAKFKGWKRPRLLAQREYNLLKVEKKESSTDTLLYRENTENHPRSFFITRKFKMPEAILSGKATEYVIDGKSGVRERWVVTGDSYIVENDELADTKNHIYQPAVLKLMGASVAQTTDESRYKFEKGYEPGVSVEKLTEASMREVMILKGKIFKKATEQKEDSKLASYSEMFVIDRVYLSEDEAKALDKNKPVIDNANFEVPKGIPAPPAAAQRLKEAITERKNEE